MRLRKVQLRKMKKNLLRKSISPNSLILGIETSCDETAVAVLRDGKEVLSSVVSSQINLHSDYGGVIPEVASRAHLELLLPVVEEAIKDVPELKSNFPQAIAATNGPGLVGALLVGVSAAKALSLALDIPFVGVNHLEAHLFATFLEEEEIALPLVVLLVSGGHTMLVHMKKQGDYQVLGKTRDDAVGEAFDKTARALGLKYPGGPEIDRLAAQYKERHKENTDAQNTAIEFPRPMINDGLDFSFSGLKTAVMNYLMGLDAQTNTRNIENAMPIAASFQDSVVDVLETKTMRAVEQTGAKAICVAGGVAANSQLRERLKTSASQLGIPCYLASKEMCTDNAVMVAAAGWWQLKNRGSTSLDSSVDPSLKLS